MIPLGTLVEDVTTNVRLFVVYHAAAERQEKKRKREALARAKAKGWVK